MKKIWIIFLSLEVLYSDAGRVKRIVGGKKSRPHKYPWQTYIEIIDKSGEDSRCGGTIIGPRHVLTAAHCLMDKCGKIVSKVKVHLGAHDICEEDWVGTHLVRPGWMVFHPGYNPHTDDNDIVILRLKRDIRFGPKVWMISLPSDEATRDCPVEEYNKDFVKKARKGCDYQDYDEYGYDDYDQDEDDYYYEGGDNDYDYHSDYNQVDSPDTYKHYVNHPNDEEDDNEIEYDYEYSDNCTTFYDGKWATVAGWGATYKFDGSCILRQAKKKIYPNHHNLCLDESDYVMDRDKICAYNPKWYSDSCQGDSGSGLVVIADDGPVLVGIVSYGWDCGDDQSPGVYTRIQLFKRWIHSIIFND
eukprot:TRINITY_DN6066_c0_g1_i1.p1 TRINITY_DN6066_c0_g1~~TRINITY_DN6066_c0_g1_i1.p1  ORF type:complete len:358 (-),score=85.17 TRINITY_DN6066_c0_g1_i1:105-1178(-)